ncbi:hypothetical protein T10_7165 [Trichinella papuae]|uniref:Uncharacterized protein n=1 Tax=Trichinella papuae TaxID=268474 RepID=A0A0V1MGS9_9BILA|nr:hypothetical protein T10_7165 [Trichinella papuae]
MISSLKKNGWGDLVTAHMRKMEIMLFSGNTKKVNISYFHSIFRPVLIFLLYVFHYSELITNVCQYSFNLL